MYDFVSESFNRNISYEYKLSIQVSLNGFSFCVLSPEDNRVLAFKQVDFVISSDQLLARRFRDWHNEEELLQLPYRQRDIILYHPDFSLLPEEHESPEMKGIINELLHDGSETEYAEGWIKAINAKLLYHLPPDWTTTVNETLGESRLIHPVQKLIGYQKRSPEANQLLICFDEKDMYLTLKINNELVLCNYFRIGFANDALYFILTILQQHGISPRKMHVQTCGKVSYLEELRNLMLKYFPEIHSLLPQHLAETELSDTLLTENLCLF